jgi:hypothetical protein
MAARASIVYAMESTDMDWTDGTDLAPGSELEGHIENWLDRWAVIAVRKTDMAVRKKCMLYSCDSLSDTKSLS